MIALLTVSLFVGCSQAQPGEMDKLTYRYSWMFSAGFAPAFLGFDKGFFADEGIDVILKPGAGIANTQLIGNGVEQFADEGYQDVIEAVQAGMPVKAVFARTQLNPVALISRADNPINHPKDLEGKTVASGMGAGSLALLPALMKAAGADIDKVTIRTVDWGAVQEVLMLGKVDAVALYFTNTVPELEAKGVQTHHIKYSDFGVNVIGEGLIVSDELIAENPDLIRRFVRALQKSWQYAADNPDETVDIFMKHNADWEREPLLKTHQNNVGLFRTANTQGKPLGWMAKEDWELSQDIMINYLELEQKLPVESYYTNEFVPQ